MTEKVFDVGQRVAKVGGDYSFIGTVRTRFTKKSGEIRYAVENEDGVLHIYSGKNLEPLTSLNMPHPEKELASFLEKYGYDHHCSTDSRLLAVHLLRYLQDLSEFSNANCSKLNQEIIALRMKGASGD